MIAAIAVYVAASALLIALERRLAHATHGDATLAWLNDHVYTPLARSFVLLLFIVIAYPQLLGLGDDAPSLARVLREGRADALITALFVSSLALPVAPGLHLLPGAVLASQGILACCLLTAWVADTLGVSPPRLWMGSAIVLQVIVILIVGSGLGRALLQLYPRQVRVRAAPVALEATRLAAEVPAIALYGWALGRQFVESAAR